ncbi:MAG: glycosyltransferase family 4 protein [Flavobacteriales bacterium]
MEIKNRILLCLHLPPPTHGASIVGEILVKNIKSSPFYESTIIKINTTYKLSGGRVIISVLRFVKLVLRTIVVLLRTRPELIYVTPSSKGIAFVKDYFYVRCIAFFYDGPILAHFHNKGVRENTGRFSRILYRHFFSRVTPILLSSRLLDDLSDYLTAEDIQICANGLGTPTDEIPTRKTYDFLFLSNLIEEKGIWTFLEACKMLRNSGCVFTAAVVGAEADVEIRVLKDFVVNEGLVDVVHILGPQYGADKRRVFEQSRTFVFPSYYHYECMPLAVLEAMSFGLAIVSTREGALEDLVENGINGLIVKRRNIEDLFEKLAFLLSNEKALLLMQESSRVKYSRDFTEQAFVNRMDHIFRAAIKS